MSEKTRYRIKDLISGFFFFALGLSLSMVSATKFSVWEKGEPQEGFFPLVTGFLMVGLGIIVAFRSYTREIHGRDKIPQKRQMEYGAGNFATKRLIGYLILIGLYGVFLENLGFIISSTLFLTSVLKILERKSWKVTLLVTMGAVMTSYFLFRFFLNVPLPPGPIYW